MMARRTPDRSGSGNPGRGRNDGRPGYWFAAGAGVGLSGISRRDGFFLAGDLASDLNLFGVVGFALIFFTLTLGLASRAARDQRWGGTGELPTRESLAEFVEDDIEIATGTISGREALVQILVLPMTLAAGMVVIGLIFAAL